MDRLTRKELKSDPLAVELQHSVEFVTGHRQQLVRYGAAALVVIVLGAAFYFYRQNQTETRRELLSKAIQISQTSVGPAVTPDAPSYATQQAKEEAETKAFTEITAKYSGTDEGTVAEFYLASMAADAGKLDEAEKRYRAIVDDGTGAYVSLGKLALAKVYASQGKTADAEKLIRSVIDKPTLLVSKEAATVALARVLAPAKPKEALALLAPLRASERTAISKTAIDAITDLKLQ